MNEQQLAAVEATGEVFVSAGAGTGKTAVLVERFVRAVCDRGLDVDSILVITYTRRAAGELRTRIRAELGRRGRDDLARELDGAWISTIHGFCLRLLKTYPFAAGLDPRFRELDDAQAAVLRGEAFRAALASFCAGGEPDRLKLLATYGADGLRRMLTGVYETLRSAGRELRLDIGGRPELAGGVDELREAARCLAEDADATENQRNASSRLLELLDRDTRAERLMDLSGFRASGERAATYEDARRAVEQSALDEVAAVDRALLQQLLELFAVEFDAAKARESALDFEDLQLRARDLLRRDDTEVFYVGDEFQSIYGFRHADVAVFRERREAAAQLLPLTNNYRSRPEVLAAVNYLFGSHFGDEFQPLAAASEFPDPVFGHPVELLVTDKASYADSGVHWRRGEAQAIARRVRELVDAGVATPGEIVLLFAAGTDAEWYEDELRKAGLPTYRATGKGYFGQQQVADLLGYLRLLHNRYDDRALLTVLASPFVGISNDGLGLIRRAAFKKPLFAGIEHALPPQLDERDTRLLRAFRQRFDRLSDAMARLSLERLCERIVGEHDYDLAVLAQWDGRRRYANMRKLARLARSYEELRGPDVEGFVRFVADQEALGARELEAVAEEEGADAVRLLTIHAAKGLEFKVVIVADAGRDKAPPSPDEILALADGRFGFRVADPVTTKRRGAFDYEEIKEARREEEREERLRLYYVAMTRAQERLIVSGAVGSDANTPIGWVLERLEVEPEEDAEIARGDARLLLHDERYHAAPEVAAPEPEAGQLALFAELAEAVQVATAPVLPPLVAPPEPPLHRPRRLSFTALSTFEQCSYKYYAIYGAGMKERRPPALGDGDGGLRATEIGDAVHRLLEQVDLAAPAVPDIAQVREWYPTVSDEELARVRTFVESYCGSELARRVATLAGVEKERHFTFEHDGVLLHGFVDAMHLDGENALVVDYKTNLLGEASPEEIVDADYRLQRLVYALACFRAGATRVEVVYHFLERADAVVSTTFTADEVAALEAELSAGIERIKANEFRPTPSDFACSTCPALELVCAGPRLRTTAVALETVAT
jgi:ATP-dependent exoDNAse (exonuclease V) beta subunit